MQAATAGLQDVLTAWLAWHGTQCDMEDGAAKRSESKASAVK